jgi:hypothetical protein
VETTYLPNDPRPSTREERRKSRQGTSYGLLELMTRPLPKLRTLSVRSGLRSEVPDGELIELSKYYPDLINLDVPCPGIAVAVQAGILDSDTRKDIEEQAVSNAFVSPNKR